MNDKFEYEYESLSFEEKKEVESIRKIYLPKDQKSLKLERIRKLNNRVNYISNIISYSLGIGGILLFGLGLTFFLEWTSLFYYGFIFVIPGVLLMIITYPLYKIMKNKLINKYRDEILKLTNELSNDTGSN